MTRATVVIRSTADREQVARWARNVEPGTAVEFRKARRTTDQNALMWSLLTQISQQKEHCGRRYPPECWKALFMHALGQEMQFIPALDGTTFLPLGMRTSNLTKQEMTDLIEVIFAWGAKNGVVFREDTADAA